MNYSTIPSGVDRVTFDSDTFDSRCGSSFYRRQPERCAGQVVFGRYTATIGTLSGDAFLGVENRFGTERMKLYDECDIWMPRVESFAKFSKPIMAEEAIYVRLRTQFKGEKTVRMDFEILSGSDRSLLAEGYVTAVCIDRQSSRSRPLPAAMREVFARAEATDQ
jgi:acyl-CoA thioesterase FadM